MSNAPHPFGNDSNNPYAAPPPAAAAFPFDAAQSEDEESQIALGLKASQGARVAGVVLVINAVLFLAEMLVLHSTPGESVPRTPLPAIIDAVIGTSLALGNPKWRRWAMVRIVLGYVFAVVIAGASGQFAILILQALVSGGFLLLLIGNPSRLRITAGCTLFGVYALLEVIGLATSGST